ncbi:phosphate transporter 3;1 [Actinidia rufa]|uniref:Phosphate transporter 31 n=1 Tax=Actinidia rufa TaxID=165716 RepID=A0A7J0H2L7_9ERIC|nr:phosphate transporter 3;1 [Actinidia rufa]
MVEILLALNSILSNYQIDPVKYKSVISGFGVLVREQGIQGLFRGWVPTLLGYSAQGACKYGFYEYFKKYYSDIVGPEYATKYKTLIYLAGSGSAEVIAGVALCPFEAVKVRVQTQPGFAKGFSDGLPKFVKSEGFTKGLFHFGDDRFPGTIKEPEKFITIDGDQRINPEYTSWRKIDRFVMSCLKATLTESIGSQVLGSSTSAEICNQQSILLGLLGTGPRTLERRPAQTNESKRPGRGRSKPLRRGDQTKAMTADKRTQRRVVVCVERTFERWGSGLFIDGVMGRVHGSRRESRDGRINRILVEIDQAKYSTSPKGEEETTLWLWASSMETAWRGSMLNVGLVLPRSRGFGDKHFEEIMGDQSRDTMMKFASFETIVELMYKHVVPTPKEECSKTFQLGLSFVGGYIAGIFCAIVSHPADNLVSFLNNAKGATVRDAVNKLGVWGLFTRGLPLRIAMIGTLTGAQWGLYDSFKVAFGLPTTGGITPPATVPEKM